MVHPVQSVIESLYAAGRCPRLHVNALFDGVVCPDFIREQWRERLIIDLDPSYPLDLTFEEQAISADLSFGGYVTRCTFPYGGIYVVADRSTGRGIVLDQNMPESVRRSRQAQLAKSSEGAEHPLRSVPEGPEDSPASTDDADADADAEAEAEAEAQEEQAQAQEPASEQPAPETEDQAQKRRAAFRVIDGGD